MAAKIRAWRAARVSPAAENSFPMLSIVMPRRRRLPVPGPSTLYQGRSYGEMGTRWKTEEAIPHLSCYISFVQKNIENVLKIHWLNWQFREQCSLLRSVTDIWDNFGFFWSSPLLVQHYCCVIKIFISGPWLLSLESSTEMKQVVRSCHAAPVFTVSVLEPHRAGRNQCVLHTVGEIKIWSLHRTGGVLICLLFSTAPL